MAKLRKKHVKLAFRNTSYDKVVKLLDGAKTPAEVIDRCEREAKRLGLRVVKKNSTSLKWSKMTTTFYREIRLGTEYDRMPEWAKAALWAHEMVHVYQWRDMGRAKFARRYMWAPTRWAIEMEAYRITIFMRQRFGVERVWNERYIGDLVHVFRSAYGMWRIQAKSLRKNTVEVLSTALAA